MPRSSTARAPAPTSPDSAPDRQPRTILVRDLDIAPENLRAGEPPDADIPLLADTLFAAGQLMPITVRPGRRKEAAYMALDGRRRILALRLLCEQGRITDDFPVEALVETDPARQAAAVVLTNTAVPVHVADVIAAIGRMLKSKLDVRSISRALGYAEVDVKRLAALSALPEVALTALRSGRLHLRQAKLLARLPDPDDQAELAQAALDGHGFPDWRVTEKLDRSQITTSDPRCSLVRPEQYAGAGGRSEADLFGERAPVLLDPAILTDLWIRRVAGLASIFEAEGLAVHLSAGEPPQMPDDLESPGYVYGGRLTAAEMAAYREARTSHEAAAAAIGELLDGGAEDQTLDQALVRYVRAGLVMDQIAFGGRVATTLVIGPSGRTGIHVDAYTPVEPEIEDEEPAVTDDGVVEADPPRDAPEFAGPEPEIEGVGHRLHALRKEVATQGLVRALADDPAAALTALIARLFSSISLQPGRATSGAALALGASAFMPVDGRVIEGLDGEVRRRLDECRAAWEASGLTVIAWVHGLDQAGKLALLATLTALLLDLREDRTTAIRRGARGEAAELAVLCDARITRYWTPDAAFLKPHSRVLLLAMLDAMGEADLRAASLKKEELIIRVADLAAQRVWAPSALSWCPEAAEDGSGLAPAAIENDQDAAANGAVPDDGRGGFAVTDAGRAVLRPA